MGDLNFSNGKFACSACSGTRLVLFVWLSSSFIYGIFLFSSSFILSLQKIFNGPIMIKSFRKYKSISSLKRAQNEKEFFDNQAENNSEYWGWQTRTGELRHLLRGELAKSHLRLGKGMRGLEIGCGIRGLSGALADIGAVIFVTDISPKSVYVARKRLKILCNSAVKAKRIKFKVVDAHRLGFAESAFDCVFGNAILHHLDTSLALPEIYRVLKPRGKLLFFEPNLINPEIFVERKIPFFRRLSRSSPDETAFIRWGLEKELRRVGFIDVTVMPYDFLYPAIPYILAKPFKAISDMLEKIPIVKEFAGSLIVMGTKPNH